MKKILILLLVSSLLSNPINAGQENNDKEFPINLEALPFKYYIYEEIIGQELIRKIDQELTVENAKVIKEDSRVLKHLLSFKILFDAFKSGNINLTQTPNAAKIIVEKLTRRLLSLNPREVLKFSDAQIIQKGFNKNQIDTLANLESDNKQIIFRESSRRFQESLTTLALNYRQYVNQSKAWYKKYNLNRKKPLFNQYLMQYDPEKAPLIESIFQKTLRIPRFKIKGYISKCDIFSVSGIAFLAALLTFVIIYSIRIAEFCPVLSGEEEQKKHFLVCCQDHQERCCDYVTHDECQAMSL